MQIKFLRALATVVFAVLCSSFVFAQALTFEVTVSPQLSPQPVKR